MPSLRIRPGHRARRAGPLPRPSAVQILPVAQAALGDGSGDARPTASTVPSRSVERADNVGDHGRRCLSLTGLEVLAELGGGGLVDPGGSDEGMHGSLHCPGCCGAALLGIPTPLDQPGLHAGQHFGAEKPLQQGLLVIGL